MNEWRAYDALEPFGEYREELRHGQRMAQFANYHRDPDKCPEGYPAIEFMNFTERAPEPEPPAEEPEALSAKILAQVFHV